ncbi:hypothetical protein GGF43_001700 [Coemansia sp. RSA 2618]|nr:hypothetical protein GGF43_001700 [Coemansia sp. RSA 2618]
MGRSEIDGKLDTLTTQADQVRELVGKLQQRVADGSLSTAHGLSFLEVKHHTMLSYISNLAFVALLKLHGQRIEGHDVVRNLIEDRTVLEKMKPLEQRLKYQIDKLLRGAAVASEATRGREAEAGLGTTDDPEKRADDGARLAVAMLQDDALADASAFGPRPGTLAVDVRAEDAEAAESGVYRAPRQMPVHYEEDEGLAAQRAKAERRMLERASRSRLVRDLMDEYDDRPETATASGNAAVGIADQRMERLAGERARYEEDNFTRLAMGKKERRGLRKKLNDLDDEFAHLNDFAGMAALQKSDAASSKAEVLERIRQRKRDNESSAEKAMRRRRGGTDDDHDEFAQTSIHKNKRTKFRAVKNHMSKRR